MEDGADRGNIDIDPDNADALLWALAYRMNPVEGRYPENGRINEGQQREGIKPETNFRPDRDRRS